MMRVKYRQLNGARGGQDGFTVLELAVVMSIVGILVAATAISFELSQTSAVQQACEYVMADLVRARNQAIKEEEYCTFTFDFTPATRNYQYLMNTSGKNKTVFLGERWKDEVFFLPGPPGAADAAPSNSFTYTPRGEIVGGNMGVIYLTTRTGFTGQTGLVYRIICTPIGEIEARVRNFAGPTWHEF